MVFSRGKYNGNRLANRVVGIFNREKRIKRSKRLHTESLKNKICEITREHFLYPSEFLSCSYAPQTLYCIGKAELLKTRKFTVVGSRRTPVAAAKLGEKICEDLSEAFTLVTGVADGGDTAAIEGALQGSGKIICVLAGGFSQLPQGNFGLLERVAYTGLLLSPHPFDTPVRSFSYQQRNRLLSTLGEGVLVLSAGKKSGALITAQYAFEQNKPVFAIPYAPNTAAGEGCNDLIKKGGFLTENSVDILGRFGIHLIEKKSKVALSDDETKLYVALKELGESHISELSAKSGVPAYKARAVLSALEVKGRIVAVGGNRYAPVL